MWIQVRPTFHVSMHEVVLGEIHITKSDLLEACVEFSDWIASVGYPVRVVRTNTEVVFIHGQSHDVVRK